MGLVHNLVRVFGVSLVASAYFRTTEAFLASGGCFAAVLLTTIARQVAATPKPPRSTPVPAGKVRICVAGYTHSSPTATAHYLADKIAKAHPGKYETWYYFDQYAFFKYTVPKFNDVDFPKHLKGHATSPFVWLERGDRNVIEPIGGSDHLQKWALAQSDITDAGVRAYASKPWSVWAYITGTAFHHGKAPATCAA